MMTKFNHVMLKLETASTEYNAGILCIAGVKFNMDATTETEEFVFYTNPATFNGLGLNVNVDTLRWVKDNRPEVWKLCRESSNDVVDTMTLFSTWLSPSTVTDSEIWGNGIDFVMPVLKSSFKAADIPLPYKFYNARDLRTVLSLTNTNLKEFMDDAVTTLEICRQQVNLLKHITRRL